MHTCICGRPIEDRDNLCSRCVALHEIGLEAGATEADIKSAYRAHVKAWHPDRYADDKSQQRAAERKLKKVNAAYDLLRTHEPERLPVAPPAPRAERWQEEAPEDRPQATAYAAWEQQTEFDSGPDPAPAVAQEFAYSTWAHSRPRPPAPYIDPEADDVPAADDADQSSLSSSGSAAPTFRTSFIYAALVVGIVLITYFWNAMQTKPPIIHHTASAAVVAPGANTVPAPQGQYAPPVVPEFFTLGSLKSDVVAVQGSPSSIESDKYLYGLSTVTFENEKVVGWNVNPLNPLRVRLSAPARAAGNTSYFTLGSTMDNVIAIEGTPTAIWDSTLVYGGSSVRFDDDKVIGWSIVPAMPLKAKLVPASHVDTSRGYFTSGSTKDQVVSIQGTPTSIWEDTYQYGKSSVAFEDGKVVRWSVSPTDPLRVRAPK